MAIASRNMNLAVNLDSRKAVHGLRALNQGLQGIGLQADTSRVAIAAMVGALGAATVIATAAREIGNFSEEVAKSTTIANASTEQMRRMELQYRSLAKTAPQSATEIAAGATYLARAGLKADQVMGSLKDTLLLSEIGFIDMAEAANRVTNIVTAFGLPVEELSDAVDVLAVAASNANVGISDLGEGFKFSASTAKAAGITFEETTAALSALGNAGLASGVAGRGLNQLYIGLSKAGHVVDGSILPALEGYYELSQQMAEDEFVSYVFENLTVNAGRALLALVQQKETMRDLIYEFENAGGAAEKMAEKIRQNLNYEFRILHSNVVDVYLEFSKFVDLPGIVQNITGAVKLLGENMHWVVGIVKSAALALATYFASGWVGTVIGSLVKGIAAISRGLVFIVAHPLKTFTKLWGAAKIAFTFFLTNWKVFMKSIPTAVVAMVAFRDAFRDSSLAPVRQLGNILEAMVRTIRDLVGMWFPSLADFSIDFKSTMQFVADAMEFLIEGATALAQELLAMARAVPYVLHDISFGRLGRDPQSNPAMVAAVSAGEAKQDKIAVSAATAYEKYRMEGIVPEQNNIKRYEANIADAIRRFNEGGLSRVGRDLAITDELNKISESRRKIGEYEAKLASIHASAASITEPTSYYEFFSQQLAGDPNSPTALLAKHKEIVKAETENRKAVRVAKSWEPVAKSIARLEHGGSTRGVLDILGNNEVLDQMSQDIYGYQAGFGRFDLEDDKAPGRTPRTLADVQRENQWDRRFGAGILGMNDSQLAIAQRMRSIAEDIADLETASNAEKRQAIELALQEQTTYQGVLDAYTQKQQQMQAVSDMVTSTGQTLADGLIGAFTAGGDAAEDMGERIKGIMKDMVTNVLSNLARIGLTKIGTAIASGGTGGASLVASFFDPTGNLFKNANGGSYTVKGSGSGEVPVRMWASPGEMIDVTPRGRGGTRNLTVAPRIDIRIEGDADEIKIRRGVDKAVPGIVQAVIQAERELQLKDPDYAIGG